MGDDTTKNKVIAGDNIVGCTCPTDVCEHYPKGKGTGLDFLPIHFDTSPKGIKTITLDLDEFEMIETGTKEKVLNGAKVPVAYMTFRFNQK